jgi:hypothetical protein
MIDIEFHLANNLWTINADRSRSNRSSSIWAAMPQTPCRRRQTHRRNGKRDLDESTPRPMLVQLSRYVLLKVSDTGHGMDKETQAISSNLFSPQEIGHAPAGLASVYGI